MEFEGIEIEVCYKPVRSLRLGVRRDGSARLSVPLGCAEKVWLGFLRDNVQWLRGRVEAVRRKADEAQALVEHRYEEGELFVFFGKSYPFRILRKAGPVRVFLAERALCLCAPSALTAQAKRKAVDAWYAARFDEAVQALVAHWLEVMGEKPLAGVRYRCMKSRWGSCQPERRVVCLNTRLAFYPKECLEEVVVHELCHLKEGSHGARFHALMAHYLPDYRERGERLKRTPLEHGFQG